MNDIILKGKLQNIQFSHSLNGTDYDKAQLIVHKDALDDDIISLKFKRFANKYKEGDIVNLRGNIRSHSEKLSNGKNKVEIYVFTYFDIPKTDDDDKEIENDIILDGHICKIDELRKTRNGKENIHFTLANNIMTADGKQKINNYIPCVAWGNEAKALSQLKVGDEITIYGQFHSRTYTKKLEDGEEEIRMAHEVVVLGVEQK